MGGTRKPASFDTVSGRFIFGYDTSELFKREREPHDSITSELSSAGVGVEVNTDYDSAVFQGVSITFTSNDTTANDLKSFGGTKNAWLLRFIPLMMNSLLLTLPYRHRCPSHPDKGNTSICIKIAVT